MRQTLGETIVTAFVVVLALLALALTLALGYVGGVPMGRSPYGPSSSPMPAAFVPVK